MTFPYACTTCSSIFVRLIQTLKEWKNEGWRPCGIFHLHMQLLPRFMPLPVQCGKFQLQYEDTGNFEIDFREEFPQNIKTLDNCGKGENTFHFLKLSLTQILDFFLVYFWCCQVAVLDGRGQRESGSATETFDRSSKPVVPNCLQPLSKTC